MNREELKALGLTPEQVDAVMKSHGTVVNKTKEDLDAAQKSEVELQSQLKTRDEQLVALEGKAAGNEDLLKELADQKAENVKTATEYQGKLADQQKAFAIESALLAAKARDPKLAQSALNLDIIHITEGKVTGLDEQLTALKESHDYLFEAGEAAATPGPKFSAGQHSAGKPGAVTAEQFAEMPYTEKVELQANDPAAYKELTGN